VADVIDIDSDDSFLDLPDITYEDGSRPGGDVPMVVRTDPEWRRQHGLPPLSELPPIPVIDH
jgi:hypothetical protein